jgi:hypothetical protein
MRKPRTAEPRPDRHRCLQGFGSLSHEISPLGDIEGQKLRRRSRHVRWCPWLVNRMLRLDGWSVTHKWVLRIWREDGLQRPLPTDESVKANRWIKGSTEGQITPAHLGDRLPVRSDDRRAHVQGPECDR